MPLRGAVRTACTIMLAAVFTLGMASPAKSATAPIYSGKGWRIWTERGIYSIAPETYTIAFADTTARDRLAPYLTKPAAQITTVTGVQVTVTDQIDLTPPGVCPAKRRIVVHYEHQPTGVRGMSEAEPCYQLSNNSAWGGHIFIDSEYWTQANWFSTDPTKNNGYRWNTVTHELGHIMGLAHANTDVDGDGTVEANECVATSSGTRPTMCSPNPGGYLNTVDMGKYTPPFDEPGLKQLAANWYLRS